MSNNLGIPGINTGIDTKSFIDKIMKYTKMPLDRLKQKQQQLLWKQEAYRTQNTALSQLKDLVFNLKLQSTYNTKTVNSSNSQIVTATANAGAVNGTYSITVQNLATVATNTSSAPVSVRSKVAGNSLDLTSTPITIGPGNDQISVTVDGVTQTITLTDGRTYDGTAGNTLVDLAADIQSKMVGFPTQVYVKANSDNQLVFCAAQNPDTTPYTITLGIVGADPTLTSLGFLDKATTKELVGGILSGSQMIVDASSKRFRITVGNNPAQEVILAEGTYNFNDFANEVQNKIQALGGDYASARVSVTNFNQLRITPAGATPLSIKLETGSMQDILWKMNFSNGITSENPKNSITTTATLWNQQDKFTNSTFFAGKTQYATFGFSINSQNFSFSNNTTLSNIINTINSNSAAGVTASYDEFNDKLTLTTTKTGDNNTSGKEIQIYDPNGFLGQLFNITEAGELGGTNAVFTINEVQTQRTSNSFTMNNVNFTLNGLTGANPATIVSVATDTSGVVTKITEFVNKYNEVISGIRTKLTETRATAGDNYSYYLPLTAEQKKELSEDEIKAWEEKAKQGLLHNDSIFTGALSQLRSALYRNVDIPRVLNGVPLSGTIDLTGSNHFAITVGGQKREIVLTETSYDSTQYLQLAGDIQPKLDAAFGSGRVKVSLTGSNAITFTSQNSTMIVENGAQYNGLSLLGFSNGATVKGSYNHLSQIGITTGGYLENGKLYLDTDKLTAALQNDPDGVMRLFTNSETVSVPSGATSYDIAKAKALEKSRQGIFYGIYDVLNTQISKIISQAGSSGTASPANQLGRELLESGEQIDRTEDRINAEEDRLWNIFNQMEVMIGKMNNQAAWITNMLGGSEGY
jgi:flagellar hook-associated protein 2